MYAKSEDLCTHCANLSDREVIALKDKYEAYADGNANLGKLLLFFAAALVIGLALVWMGY